MHVPADINVRKIRKERKLSQAKFAAEFEGRERRGAAIDVAIERGVIREQPLQPHAVPGFRDRKSGPSIRATACDRLPLPCIPSRPPL